MKWGDRGVGVGKFWEAREINDYDKAINNDTPNWVKRGLQRDQELIVANSSPSESPEQDYGEHDRPCTGSSNSLPNKYGNIAPFKDFNFDKYSSFYFRSYIRGQNVHLEPAELAERERKRQIAIAHQEAIRQQLEDREKRKKEEREKRIQEEREEELRIEKEQEIERKRREMELKRVQEKQERERKRKAALQEALEIAEREAREKKEKLRMQKQNINENTDHRKTPDKEETIIHNVLNNNEVELNNNKAEQQCNRNKQLENNDSSNLNEDVCNNNTNLNNAVNKRERKLNNISDSKESTLTENAHEILATSINNSNDLLTPRFHQQLPMLKENNFALLLQTPVEMLQGMQFAVLMPTTPSGIQQGLPIAVPISLMNDSEHIVERTENRILTPTQYRNKRYCNSSTQTDFVDCNRNELQQDQRYLNERFANMEINCENRNRKCRSTRNEERTREVAEERPKWGANRPPTRYIKQSEKDLLYQRRKLRQKIRQNKVYNDKGSPRSSDDSQTASPVTHRRKGYVEKRQSRALWRKNDHLFARNVSVYQTEIIPLESDKDQIYYKSHSHKCCCQCLNGNHVKSVDVLNLDHSTPRNSARSQFFDCNRDCEIMSSFNVE